MKNIDLYIFAGQSNAVGPDMGLSLPDDVRFYASGASNVAQTGIEYGFVQSLRDAGEDGEIAVVKTAWGGTSIREIADRVDWSTGSKGELYDTLIATTKAAVADLEAQGYSVTLKRAVWMQGEAEIGAMAYATGYDTTLADWIAKLRADLDAPDLPITLGEILSREGSAHVAAVQTSQHNVAATVDGVTIIDTDGYEQRDIYHFAESGYFALGERAASIEIGADIREFIYGESADDVMAGGGFLFGRLGNDKLYGRGGDDHLFGGMDNDVLLGGSGADYLNGGFGDDKLYGHKGNDSLLGGLGHDIIEGGDGADFINGGSGLDVANYYHAGGWVNVNLTTNSGKGFEAKGDTFANVEGVNGGAFNDVLAGNGAANILKGFGGNDHLYGLGGNDTLTGGSGRDLFVFRSVDLAGRDTVTDFTSHDTIALKGVGVEDVRATAYDGGVVLRFVGHDGYINVVGAMDTQSLFGHIEFF